MSPARRSWSFSAPSSMFLLSTSHRIPSQ
jgi:hypothetical protein